MEFNATEKPQSGEAKIDALLSGGGGTAVADQPAGDTPVDGQETETVEETGQAEETEQAGAETADDEFAEEGTEGEDAATEDEELRVSDLETDYSDTAYAKAAAHFSKNRTRPLDPNDTDDRAILKELMDRGRKIEEYGAKSATEEETEESEEAETEGKDKTPAQAKTPAEQIQERLKGAREYAKQGIVPEVAKEFAASLVDALWPGKDVGKNITQEQSNRIAEVFSTFAIMQIADAIPSILNQMPNAMGARYPMFDKMHDMATREAVIDELLDARDLKGAEMYPNLEQLVDSGAIKKAMNSPELKEAVFSKDPHKNLMAKIKMAWKIARNDRVDTAALEKATQRGRQQATERQRAVAAGKLPPGRTKGGFAAPNQGEDFVKHLTSGGGSKFSRALGQGKGK